MPLQIIVQYQKMFGVLWKKFIDQEELFVIMLLVSFAKELWKLRGRVRNARWTLKLTEQGQQIIAKSLMLNVAQKHSWYNETTENNRVLWKKKTKTKKARQIREKQPISNPTIAAAKGITQSTAVTKRRKYFKLQSPMYWTKICCMLKVALLRIYVVGKKSLNHSKHMTKKYLCGRQQENKSARNRKSSYNK